MAIIHKFTSNGIEYPQAYIQVSIHRCDTYATVLQLKAWTTELAHTMQENPLPSQLSDPLPTNLNYNCNPLRYAYDSLKNLPYWADAIDV